LGFIGSFLPGEVTKAKRRFYGLPLSERNRVIGLAVSGYKMASLSNLFLAAGALVGGAWVIRKVYKKWLSSDAEVQIVIRLHSVDKSGNPVNMDSELQSKLVKYVQRIFKSYKNPTRRNPYQKSPSKPGLPIEWLSSTYIVPKKSKVTSSVNRWSEKRSDKLSYIVVIKGKSTSRNLGNPLNLQQYLRQELATKYGLSAYIPGENSSVRASKIEINLPVYEHKVSVLSDCTNTYSILRPQEDLVNYYAILNLTRKSATEDSIYRAFKYMKQKHDPSRNTSNSDAKEVYNNILMAGDILMNPAKRAAYDKYTKGEVIIIRKSGGDRKGRCYRRENVEKYFQGTLPLGSSEKVYGCKLTSSGRLSNKSPLMWLPGLDIWVNVEESLTEMNDTFSAWYVAVPVEKYNIMPSVDCGSSGQSSTFSADHVVKAVSYIIKADVPDFEKKNSYFNRSY